MLIDKMWLANDVPAKINTASIKPNVFFKYKVKCKTCPTKNG